MAEIDFPDSPSEGQSWTDPGGKTWVYSNGNWVAVSGGGVPSGMMAPFAGSVAPAGWLLCDGSAVDRTLYGPLFDAIGTTYGVGDGSTTFNLPDTRDNVLGGVSAGHALADVEGSENQSLTSSQMPSHSHTGTTNSDGSHSHTASSNSTGSHSHSTSTGTGGVAHLHGITIRSLNQNAGGSNSYVHGSGQTNTWNQTSSHSHSASTTSTGSHAHTITVTAGGSHSHGFTTNTAGSGAAFSILQPTLYVNFIIKT